MIKRIYVEKRPEYSDAFLRVKHVFTHLDIEAEDFRQFVRYDIENMTENVFDIAKTTIFSFTST